MSKEIFLARISAMRSKQAKNSRAITQEDYDNIIKKLKLLEKKVKGKTMCSSFAQKPDFKEHMKSVHEGKKPFL